MNPPIKDIADYLVSNTSLVIGTSLFKSTLPEKTGTVVALFDIGGGEPEPTDIENPNVQILVRAEKGKYETAYAQMKTVTAILHKLANTTINSTLYIVVWKMTEVISLGTDKKDRPVLSCNLRIKRV